MSNKHVITLGITYFNFSSDSEEIIDFTDSQKKPAMDYGKDPANRVLKQDIIRFESQWPFLFISYTPQDWQPSGATHGPALWTQEDGSKWCFTAYSKPSSHGYALELVIVPSQNIPHGTLYATNYRIVGLEENPTLTSTSTGPLEKTIGRLGSVLHEGVKVLAPPGKPTINITGS